MPIVRFMTEEEEEEYSPFTGFANEEAREIVLRKGYPSKDLSRTLRHELGHIKYPVEIPWGSVEELTNWEEYYVKDLFRELGAAYYALTIQTRDPDTKYLIRKHKKQAREDGLTSNMIARIDRIARERVGYMGKEEK